MADVFISYAREDGERVKRIAEAVAAEGYSVWWDRDLPPHKSYGDVIGEKIDDARAVIVVWSETSVKSHWVRAEANRALEQNKLIQAGLDATQPPLPFNLIHSAALGDWLGEPDRLDWRKIKESLAELCGEARSPVTPVAERVATPSPEHVARPNRDRRIGLAVGATVIVAILLAAMSVLVWRMLDRPESVAQSIERPSGYGFDRAAVIDDPDGYTNLREGPSVGSPVLARVNDGQRFMTHEQPGEWWQVITEDGTIGYMSRSRIRFVEQ